MRIGILTFHNSSNYGAALQAFATQEAVKTFGAEVEILDYTSRERLRKYSPVKRISTHLYNGNILGVIKEVLFSPGVILRNFRFSRFYEKNLERSSHIGSDKCLLKEKHREYDVIISGSDQVWSLKNNGEDFSYLLDFVDAAIKASYASSFGLLQIPEKFINEYSRVLSGFDFLSTREEAGRSLIHQLAKVDSKVVVDPVLLHGKKFWDALSKPQYVRHSNFDLFYVNNTRFIDKQIGYTADYPKLPIVSIGSFRIRDLVDPRFLVRNGADPCGFLWFIKSARIVFTTSYHAVLFCLIFNKPFFVFMSGNGGRDERIRHVLRLYGLESRIVEADASCIDIDAPLSFEQYARFSEIKVAESYEFLGSVCYQASCNVTE